MTAPEQKRRTDYVLLLSVLALLCFGLIMVYSASHVLAAKRFGDAAHFFTRQLIFALTGLGVMLLLSRIDYRRLYPAAPMILGLGTLLVVLVLVPGLGFKAGGSMRWIKLGPLTIQPSEFAKLALVIFLAAYLSRRQKELPGLKTGFLRPLGAVLVLVGPVLIEPDLGMAVILILIGLTMMFVAGTRLRYLAVLAASGAAAMTLLVVLVPYRWKRLIAWLASLLRLPEQQDLAGAGYQVWHSKLAFGSGGLAGMGLGESWQKMLYLPEPHTDFIFSVLAEELGFFGVATVLSLFFLLVWRGIQVSTEAPDLFGTYLALGATLVVGFQAFGNVAVVMGLLPTKGMTLPLISYGGSSLWVNLMCVGVLMNVSEQRWRQQSKNKAASRS
ncbi:MAG: putative lipid II flippase FtsW [Proteobacteria bacterium]|nr:putative lipid II flippase FtsW [Pseudomonadota bacterium]